MVGFLTPKIAQRASPTPPTLGNPALDAARAEALDVGQNVYGRQQPILSGATSSAPGTVQKKVLLGG